MTPDATQQPRGARWEQRYRGTSRLWSGRPNAALVDVASGLRAGRSLDVGCGEGADVIWLAEHGWSADGIDLSPTAIDRARSTAEERGLPGARFHVGDLLAWSRDQAKVYNLVTAFFLHSTDGNDRIPVLRRAAELVGPAGRLLLVSHATMPPWASSHHHHDRESRPITPEAERSTLRLGAEWITEIAETRPRDTIGPDGQQTTLEDNILLLRHSR